MRALVTGGVGFIGTNLIKRLLSDGWNVVSMDNYHTGKIENEQNGCLYIDIDISDKIDIQKEFDKYKLKKPDIIYHLAAIARIAPSIQNPSKSLLNNIDSTINVLEYARNYNVPVVYAGSSSAHGDIYSNPYTFSKWNGEELCKLYSNVYNLPLAICRFYNVYGDGQLTEGAYCTVLGIFERQFKSGKPLTITSDGEQKRDFTDVIDIVDGLLKCGANINEVCGEIFELGNGKNYSINQLADAFGDYPRKYLPEKPGEVRESLNVDTKAFNMLGWKPKGDIITYIKENYILDK